MFFFKQNMKITFRENVFVRDDFLSKGKENELLKINRFVGALLEKLYSPFNFREIDNLKISLHLVYI